VKGEAFAHCGAVAPKKLQYGSFSDVSKTVAVYSKKKEKLANTAH
jgi:hypothetical protein